MDRKKIVALCILAALLTAGSVPRVSEVRRDSAENIEKYTVLADAVDGWKENYSLYEADTADTIQIVTLRNLWGSWEGYILPVFGAQMPNIPTAGSVDISACFHVVSVWEKDNLFTRMVPLKVTQFGVAANPGRNTYFYELAEVRPMDYMVDSAGFRLEERFAAGETVTVRYSASTYHSADVRDEQTATEFTWQYTVSSFGREITAGTHNMTVYHTVNA